MVSYRQPLPVLMQSAENNVTHLSEILLDNLSFPDPGLKIKFRKVKFNRIQYFGLHKLSKVKFRFFKNVYV